MAMAAMAITKKPTPPAVPAITAVLDFPSFATTIKSAQLTVKIYTVLTYVIMEQ